MFPGSCGHTAGRLHVCEGFCYSLGNICICYNELQQANEVTILKFCSFLPTIFFRIIYFLLQILCVKTERETERILSNFHIVTSMFSNCKNQGFFPYRRCIFLFFTLNSFAVDVCFLRKKNLWFDGYNGYSVSYIFIEFFKSTTYLFCRFIYHLFSQFTKYHTQYDPISSFCS